MIQFSNLHKCFLTKWIHHNTGASVFFFQDSRKYVFDDLMKIQYRGVVGSPTKCTKMDQNAPKCTKMVTVPWLSKAFRISYILSRHNIVLGDNPSGRKSYLFPEPEINKPALEILVPFLFTNWPSWEALFFWVISSITLIFINVMYLVILQTAACRLPSTKTMFTQGFNWYPFYWVGS